MNWQTEQATLERRAKDQTVLLFNLAFQGIRLAENSAEKEQLISTMAKEIAELIEYRYGGTVTEKDLK